MANGQRHSGPGGLCHLHKLGLQVDIMDMCGCEGDMLHRSRYQKGWRVLTQFVP
jgi:hypothetical protein